MQATYVWKRDLWILLFGLERARWVRGVDVGIKMIEHKSHWISQTLICGLLLVRILVVYFDDANTTIAYNRR